jgi:hypothetical protein
MRHFTTLLGCIWLSGCTSTAIQPSQSFQAGSVSDVSVHQKDAAISRYAKLNSRFLEKIKTVPDEGLQSAYEQGIHELHRIAQRDPSNRVILEKLVQHQEQTLELFRVCGEQSNVLKSFRWVSLSHSLFWRQPDNSYLGLLICDMGTSNQRFVPFLYWEEPDKAQLKPLSLTRFQKVDRVVQRVDAELNFGRTFPNSDQWYDPKKEELRVWTRFSGGSHLCGTQAVYRLQDKQLVLQEFMARFECDPRKKVDDEKLYPL